MGTGENISFDDNGNRVPSVDFDFAALDGSAPADAAPERLSNLLAWLSQPRAVRYFGRAFKFRLLVLAWTMNSAAFDGKSLSALATEQGITPQCLSRYAAEAARIFGFRNRSQVAHGSRWKKRLQRGR